jgi:membrane-associated protein
LGGHADAYHRPMLLTILAAGGAIDPKNLLETFGTVGLFAIVFAETGLLIGFFLPGDSLLVLAGLICAVGTKSDLNVDLNLGVILVGLAIAAVAGAQTGYFIGRKAGPALFSRPSSRLFKHEHVEKAQRYFDKYGAKTIVLGRFIPIVRTFANPMAGVAGVEPRTFATYNLIGGVAWTTLVTMLGFVLGKTIPSAEDHLLVIEGVIILLSILPIAYELLRARRDAKVSTPA